VLSALDGPAAERAEGVLTRAMRSPAASLCPEAAAGVVPSALEGPATDRAEGALAPAFVRSPTASLVVYRSIAFCLSAKIRENEKSGQTSTLIFDFSGSGGFRVEVVVKSRSHRL
jgi:hypothetical protein